MADSTDAGSFLIFPAPVSASNTSRLKSVGSFPKSFNVFWFSSSLSAATLDESCDSGSNSILWLMRLSAALPKIFHAEAPAIWLPSLTKLVSKAGPTCVFFFFWGSWGLSLSALNSLPLPLPLPRPLPRPRPPAFGAGAGSGSLIAWPHDHEQGKSWIKNYSSWTTAALIAASLRKSKGNGRR